LLHSTVYRMRTEACSGIVVETRAREAKNGTNPNEGNDRYLTAGKKDLVEFCRKIANGWFLFCKTADFNRSPIPPFLVLAYSLN